MQIENISTKLDDKVFILFVLLLSYLVRHISQLVSLFSSKTILTKQETNLKIKESIVTKQASEQFTQKMMSTCSFHGTT